MLGSMEDRRPGKPVLTEDGNYVGGIAFERHLRAVNISGSQRAYQLATTFQTPKALSAPGRQAKAPTSGVLDSDALMRKNIVKVSNFVQVMHSHIPYCINSPI